MDRRHPHRDRHCTARRSPAAAAHRCASLLKLGIIALTLNFDYRPPLAPPGWIGVNNHIQLARWIVGREIANWQAILSAGTQGKRTDELVLAFGEGLLDDWHPGTRAIHLRYMSSLGVPARSAWLIGRRLRRARPREARERDPVSVMRADAVLIGGDWLPWSHSAQIQRLRPAWWQRTFNLEGQRV